MKNKRQLMARARQLRLDAASIFTPVGDRAPALAEAIRIEKIIDTAEKEIQYARIAPKVAQGPGFIRWMDRKFTTAWRITARKTPNLAALYETIPPWRLKRLQISYVKYLVKNKLPLIPPSA